MNSDTKHVKRASLPIIVRILGYLIIQAFALMLVSRLPWPIVDVYFFGPRRQREVPDPVWVLFWTQFVLGIFLPLRGKTFLMGQFCFFVQVFLSFMHVEQLSGSGDWAVISWQIYTLYWFQFFATGLGLNSLRYRKFKAIHWFPLIAYFLIQFVTLWVITEIRMPVRTKVGDWLLLAFLSQFVGLLFVSSRIRLYASAQILICVSLAHLPSWLPTGSFRPNDPIYDLLWIIYVFQFAGLSWWWFTRSRKSIGDLNERRKFTS